MARQQRGERSPPDVEVFRDDHGHGFGLVIAQFHLDLLAHGLARSVDRKVDLAPLADHVERGAGLDQHFFVFRRVVDPVFADELERVVRAVHLVDPDAPGRKGHAHELTVVGSISAATSVNRTMLRPQFNASSRWFFRWRERGGLRGGDPAAPVARLNTHRVPEVSKWQDRGQS
ncbi:MAG: hypothetical protein HY526_08105 [Betaproteobacteria bacterium]|nr:hypothetical protein [Betaproteobacteria bacterium]